MELGKVIVDGASYMVIADAPVVTVPVPAIPAGSLSVSSDNKLTSEGKKAALKSDMEGQTPVAGIGYINPPYTVPGTLSWDGVLSGSQESVKLTKSGSGAIVDDTDSGAVEWTVVVPAQMPPTASTPDPNTSYPGTWTLLNANQTKLNTVE